jgi:hypothetical protein
MTCKITFYAILGGGTTVDRPSGLLRRLQYDNGREDEGLQKDMSWRRTSLLIEHEHGSSEEEFVEVTHEQASDIVRYFRDKFANQA